MECGSYQSLPLCPPADRSVRLFILLSFLTVGVSLYGIFHAFYFLYKIQFKVQRCRFGIFFIAVEGGKEESDPYKTKEVEGIGHSAVKAEYSSKMWHIKMMDFTTLYIIEAYFDSIVLSVNFAQRTAGCRALVCKILSELNL